MICLLEANYVVFEDELLEMAAVAAAEVIIVGSVDLNNAQRYRKKSVWLRPIFEMRRSIVAYNLLLTELRQSSDNTLFSGFTRMSPDMFDSLLTLVEDIHSSHSIQFGSTPPLLDLSTSQFHSKLKSHLFHKSFPT